jgi:hypothetical protein
MSIALNMRWIACVSWAYGPFAEGEELTIRIKVVQFEAGSQMQRWFWGGIGNAGEGSLQVLAGFYDDDAKLAEIQTEGRIGSGFFGGSMTEAVDKAAEQIATYAITNFRCPQPAHVGPRGRRSLLCHRVWLMRPAVANRLGERLAGRLP